MDTTNPIPDFSSMLQFLKLPHSIKRELIMKIPALQERMVDCRERGDLVGSGEAARELMIILIQLNPVAVIDFVRDLSEGKEVDLKKLEETLKQEVRQLTEDEIEYQKQRAVLSGKMFMVDPG